MTPRPGAPLATLIFTVAVAACSRSAPSPSAQASPPPSVPVRTVAVEGSGGGGTVAVPATVHARRRAALAARVPASVTALPWREGDRVASGAVVVRLDDTALRSRVDASEAAAHAADRDLARVEALLAKGAATPREADESRARASAAAAALAAARDDLAYAVLRAPFAGTVAARPVDVGDVVQPGATLVEIEGDDGLEVRTTVEAELLPELVRGTLVQAAVDGQPWPLEATVSAVSASGDPASHRFEVRADLPRAEGLRSGLFARLHLPSGSAEARLLVPESAVVARGGLSGLFVVAEGTARLRWVAVGSTANGMTEVRAGVEAGERVALAPADLADGQPVAETAEAR